MKKLFLFLALHTVQLFAAAPATVTVASTYYNADSSLFDGRIRVTSPPFICSGVPVAGIDRTYTVTSGVVSIALVPNVGCVGTVGYTVRYIVGNTTTTRYWSIPASPSTTTIDAVQSSIQPTLGLHISLANLPFGAVGPGQYLGRSSDGLSWVGYPAAGEPPITAGTINQYWRGDKTWQPFPTIPTNTSQLPELTNLYFTNARVLAAMSGLYNPLITAGSSGQYWRWDKTWAALNVAAVDGLTTALAGKEDTLISSGATTPSSTPSRLGLTYIDTVTELVYNAVCTTSSACWRDVAASGESTTVGIGLSIAGVEVSVDETLTPLVADGSGAPSGACVGVRRYRNTTDQSEYYCGADAAWHAVGTGTGTGGGGTTGLYSGTLNFGSIPDLGCAALTLTATGLTTGKTLALSLPAALETGLIGTAFASAADTATVRLCNVSGASVDPASATFAVRDMDALGYLTASATINFAEIADGNCLASTVTLSGAASGDNVAAGWPAALETGLTGSMFVSAADTVAVRLCNFSGAAVDPASGTFKAAITR